MKVVRGGSARPRASEDSRMTVVRESVAFVLFALACACCSRASTNADAGAEPSARYGVVMVEVGRRFEAAGRAARAGRWELCGYELHELEEAWTDDLPHATPPAGVDPATLRTLAEPLGRDHLKALDAAAKARDGAAFDRAFATTANGCNGCHQAALHGFIEIPTQPGSAVPKMDPSATP
jgi:hypothetical protein